MAGTYGDTPDDRHTSGYLSRWPAREQFLSALYELAPHVFRELLDPDAFTCVLEPARSSVIRTSQPYPYSVSRFLFDREDGLFNDMDWANGDVHLHPDYRRLNPEDETRVMKVLHGMGRERIVALWEERQIEQIDLGMTVSDYLGFASFSNDDGEIFRKQVRDVAPALMQHLHHWATRFNLGTPWMFMVGGFTILEAARTHTARGYVTPGRNWGSWYQDFGETFLEADALSIDIRDVWNPRKELKASARKRISARVEDELDRIEAGIQATSHRRTRKTQPEHFRWLVQYQVLRKSYGAIAKEALRDWASVNDGVKRTADLIELPLREHGRGGRPKKSEQSDNP